MNDVETSIDEEVVGFRKDAEILMQKLTGGPRNLDIISIVGMPGLSKTTLAKKVYNNPSIVSHFDVRAWCVVSRTYNVRKLLVEIFKQATRDKININEGDDVADKLRKLLIGKRYLVVLDDIWEVNACQELQFLSLRDGENQSRIMITTRDVEVARQLKQQSDPYSLRFLTKEESWELLQKKVFRGEECPPELYEAGLKVAKNCKGLPLVIVLIAGIIGKKERKAPLWLDIANDLSSFVLEEQSMKIIQSSYDHFEDHVKACLLYMGLFPEDYKIPMYDLRKF